MRRRRGEEEEKRRGEEKATDIKSNNPHLAGGEKALTYRHFYTQTLLHTGALT